MAKAAALFVFSVVVAVGVASDQYVSEIHEDVKFECSGGQTISKLRGHFNRTNKDRYWDITCQQAPAELTNCHWTNFVDEYRKTVNLTCQEKEVVTGMNSIYNKESIDRKYQIKCCQVVQKSTHNCTLYYPINEILFKMNFQAPKKQYVTGLVSEYDEEYNDRSWRVYLCYLV